MLNCKFKAIYQDKDWLISQVKLGKDAKTIAKELGVTNQIIVPLSEIVIEVDEEDESANIITIPVPTFNRDADTVVKFSLTGVAYPDGMDYSQYVSAEYTTAGYSDTTGITNINITFLDNIYTIDGKSVKNSLKPNTLYIINGKKTIVK